MRFVSLFAGIGGLDLGLERAGWQCVAQVEKDEFCRKVLAKHWPNVPRFEDVRDVHAADLPAADALVGGFPCQPVSVAGARRGHADERWLWPEFFRLVREVRPAWVVAENVPGLRTLGADGVIKNLESEDYTVRPLVVGADDVGAPHRRKRVFLVADAYGRRRESIGERGLLDGERAALGHDADGCGGSAMADADHQGPQGRDSQELPERTSEWAAREGGAFPATRELPHGSGSAWRGRREPSDGGWWLVEPNVGRVAHGVPARVDRLRALGNAVVPQVAEAIGRAILNSIEVKQEARHDKA